MLRSILKETKIVRFEGNNYTKEWLKEAGKRGLFLADNTPKALRYYLKPEVINLFLDFGILSKRELESKVHIHLEAYINTKEIEFKIAIDMVKTMVFPAIMKQIGLLGKAASAFGDKKNVLFKEDLGEMEKLYVDIKFFTTKLSVFLESMNNEKDILKRADAFADDGINISTKLRAFVDTAETLIAAEYWPLPRYRELLRELN